MRLNKIGLFLFVSLQVTARMSQAQQLDIYKEVPGIENIGNILGRPPIILQPVTSQPQPQIDYGEIAKKVLDGNATLTEQQLKERLEEYMKPAYGPIYSPGGLVFMAPASLPSSGNPLIPQLSPPSAEIAAISTAVVAFVNRTNGPFEFQLRIGAIGRNEKLLSNELGTYECLTDCVNGAVVKFDTSLSTAPAEVKVKGGEVYAVNYTDAGGWAVTKVDRISYLLPQ
ncbi:hypothetical protein [Rhizobium binae]|uniref:hypothetical protein n=1 Tax=Rhizobium binae TaxID=1138190 RepID=UPI001C8329C4|nr:hypothetical protein [Rhizobium binae]MBX4967824.1 hypothetical protein [Rhizobium binae]